MTIQLRHGVAGHGDVGLSPPSKPDHSNGPVGEKTNPTTNYNHLSPETVQNMFSVSSVEFTNFQCHQEAPLIHGILLKRDDFLSGMGIPSNSGKAVDS